MTTRGLSTVSVIICLFATGMAAGAAAPPATAAVTNTPAGMGKGAPPSSAARTRLDLIERACRTGDRRAVFQGVGELKALWGNTPDYDAIRNAVLSRSSDPWFRWVMLDSLVSYKRCVKNDREALSLLKLFDSISWAEDESPFVRAKALTVHAGMIALFKEKGFVRDASQREFGKRLAALLDVERDGDILTAACCAAGSAGAEEAAPALRRFVRDEKSPSIVRRTAACSLGRLNDKESIPLFTEVLNKTDDRELYGSTAFALGTMGGDEVVTPLVENAGRFDTHSCGNAIRRNSATVGRMLKDSRSPRLESAIKAAGLANLKECVPDIRTLENDGRPEVRRAAKEALTSIHAEGESPPGEDVRGEVKP